MAAAVILIQQQSRSSRNEEKRMAAAIQMEKLQPENEEKTKSTKKCQLVEIIKNICACVFVVLVWIFLIGSLAAGISFLLPTPEKPREVIDEVDKLHEEIAELKSKDLKAIQIEMQEMRLENKELKSDMRAVFGRLVEVPRKENTTRIVFEVPELKSIRKDIEGSWKLVDHMNYEGYQKAHDSLSFEKFSENLRFDTLPDGRLVQTGGGSEQLIEDSTQKSEFYEEGNHLKSYWSLASTADRFVQDGKLIRIDFFEGGVAKREYRKI